MADLDWRIPLSGESPKINTPFENLDIVLRSKANQQKLKANDLELRQQTQDAEDRDAIRQIAQQYGNDPETMLTEITKRNPVIGMKMRSDIQNQTIKGLDIDIAKRKIHADKIDEHLTGLLSVRKGDDAAWQRARAATMQEDQTVGSELPEHLLTDEDVTQRNAVAMKGMNARAILIKDLEEQNRVRDDARAAADLQRKADEDAARQNRADRTAERMEAAQQATATYQARTADAADRRAGAAERAAAQRSQTGASGSADREDADAIADAIIRGEQSPETTGLYRAGPLVRSALARKGYNQQEAITDWRATQKHVATLNGAQQTRMGQAIDNAAHSLDVIEELTKQWDAGRFPPLNRAQLALAKNGAMGTDAQKLATQLEGQISDVTSELANVYMGGNSPTDHALTLAAKNLSADWSRDQLLGMVSQSKRNLQIRANSMKNVGVAGASPNNPYAAPGQQEIQPQGGTSKGETVIEYVRDPTTGKLVRKK